MNKELLRETIIVLKTLKEDAEMALSGDWDCTTKEGVDDGFEAQLSLIEPLIDKLTKELNTKP